MPPFPPPEKLAQQIRASEGFMRPFREKRRKTYDFMLGRWYGAGTRDKHPVNMVAQYHDAYISLLAGGDVDPEVEPKSPFVEGESLALGLTLDHLYKELDYSDIRHKAIQDALLGPMAILKYGRRAGDETLKIDDRYVDMGQPYVTVVDLDDYAIDPACLTRRNARWESGAYTMARYKAAELFGRDDEEIDPEMREFVMTKQQAKTCIEGLPNAHDGSSNKARLSDAWKRRSDKRWDANDDTRLRDVAIYMDDGSTWIVTMPDDPESSGGKYLAIVPHDGPEPTPFEYLCFGFVNSNPIGVSPSSRFMDLAESSDAVMNKVIRQIMRTKRLFPTKDTLSDAKIKEIADSPDGSMPRVPDPRDIHPGMDMGGFSKDLAGGLEMLMGQFNQLSGNTQLLSGQGAGAETATENQILQGNASIRIRRMLNEVQRMDDRTARHLGWYVTTDPLYQSPPLPYRIPGSEMVTLRYDASTRKGAYLDFNFRFRHRPIDASDPAVRQEKFMRVLGDVLPRLATLVQMGIIPPEQWRMAVKVAERTFDFPDLSALIGDPTAFIMQAQMSQGMPGMAPGAVSGTAGGYQKTGMKDRVDIGRSAMQPAYQGG